jgi:N-acetylmuramoyl-L-alanine amidase
LSALIRAIPAKLSENRLNWQGEVRLAHKLNALKIPWVMTKSRENEKVTNRRRAEIANGANAYRQPTAMFIRLHCDVGRGSGFAWYYPDRAATKQGVTGPPRHVPLASRALAHTMNEAMKPVLRGSLKSNPIKTDAQTGVGGRQGGVLTGSIFAKVPTALIEMCFINNKRDARFIASAQGQEKMAQALAVGAMQWKRVYERN